MDTLRQDLRYALRTLLNRPGFSMLAILTLAIGIGVNAVAFSAFNAIVMKPMRFEGASELGRIRTIGANNPYGQTSLPDFRDMSRENRTLEDVFAEARLPLSMRAAAPDGAGATQAEAVGRVHPAAARPIDRMLSRLLTRCADS